MKEALQALEKSTRVADMFNGKCYHLLACVAAQAPQNLWWLQHDRVAALRLGGPLFCSTVPRLLQAL